MIATADRITPLGENNGNAGSLTWHALSPRLVADSLETDLEKGLSAGQVSGRLAATGYNELRETPPTPLWRRFIDQLRSFVVIVLIVAGLLSLVLGDYVEAVAIMAIVLLNALLGVVQESRAESALGSLRKMAAPVARVVRDGHHLDIPAREVVPGDMVLLAQGNYVPADARLNESVNLSVDESPFTGESVPAAKDARRELPASSPLAERANMVYRGTIVTYGRGQAVVVATGMQTEIGQIAELVQAQPSPPTPLQEKLDELGRNLSYIALALCALVFVGGVLRGNYWLDMILLAVSLAIAAVPEGLPAIVTISLALGMREMVNRHAIIRKLPAVETLGATTIICTDKTGTVTQNQMTAVRLYVNEVQYDPDPNTASFGQVVTEGQQVGLQMLLLGGLLCNDARIEARDSDTRAVGDPTEIALVRAALWFNMRREGEEETAPRVDEIPFEAERQRMGTLHRKRYKYSQS